MRPLIIALFIFSFLTTYAQLPTYKTWQIEAKKDKRMKPEYGNLKKSEAEIETDKRFVAAILSSGKSKAEGAHEMIKIGFDYLYRGDLKTAMYRFNQAYLLNPKNSEIYWGFGAVYTALGAYKEARNEYADGLNLNPSSAPILTDYATTYLGEYYDTIRLNYDAAQNSLNLAKQKLLAAYSIDPQYINTTYKLSIVYLNSNDCLNAKKYLKETRELGGQPITKEYLSDFNLRCGNCSNVKIGDFLIESSKNGLTKIHRTKNYQIEENESLGYKLKLKIDWIDACTYTLTPVVDLNKRKGTKSQSRIRTCQIIEVNEDNYIQVSRANSDKLQITSQLNFVK